MKSKCLLEVQTKGDALAIWRYLKDLHETLDEGRAFFLKKQVFAR